MGSERGDRRGSGDVGSGGGCGGGGSGVGPVAEPSLALSAHGVPRGRRLRGWALGQARVVLARIEGERRRLRGLVDAGWER